MQKARNIQHYRINNHIRAPKVRLLDEDGKQIGVVETQVALSMAHERELDLVEVASNADPPVARIIDFGKFQYQQKKKAQATRHKKTELKNIRIRLKTGRHDLELKARQIEKFLDEGHRVKIDMMLRGREKQLHEFASEKFRHFVEIINRGYTMVHEIKKEPRGLSTIIEKK